MLEDIDNKAFRNVLGEADAIANGETEEDPPTNPEAMTRIMKEVEKTSSSRKEKSPTLTMEYRSRGEAF